MFHRRRCGASFLQTCLASRYIHVHASDTLLSRGGTSEFQLHICLKGLRYNNGISFENQPILYGQLVAHVKGERNATGYNFLNERKLWKEHKLRRID